MLAGRAMSSSSAAGGCIVLAGVGLCMVPGTIMCGTAAAGGRRVVGVSVVLRTELTQGVQCGMPQYSSRGLSLLAETLFNNILSTIQLTFY